LLPTRQHPRLCLRRLDSWYSCSLSPPRCRDTHGEALISRFGETMTVSRNETVRSSEAKMTHRLEMAMLSQLEQTLVADSVLSTTRGR
jgi:hypothetical protein